jgi:putative toxin-antitoxin system antitoxin component (TIGR02293 family)
MTISSVTQLLGGKKTLGREVRTRMDLIDLSRKGVPKEALLVLAKFMGLPVSQMAALLPVTERTIQRYAPKEHFDRVVSENILHLAEVVARGLEVFENNDSFKTWIDQPSTALGGRSPKSLLASRFGIDMVLDELTRIEHGVAA